MSEKKLVSLPKVFHISAPGRPAPGPIIAGAESITINRSISTTLQDSKGTNTESFPAAMSIPPNITGKKQNVFLQLSGSRSQQTSNVVLQNIHLSGGSSNNSTQQDILAGPVTTQKAISPIIISQSIDTASEILDKFQDSTTEPVSSLNQLKTESNEIQKSSTRDKAIQCSENWNKKESTSVETQCDLVKLLVVSNINTVNRDNDEDDLFFCPPEPKTYIEKCKEIENNLYECLDCGKKCVKKIMLRHVHLHTEKSVLCQYCGKICMDRTSLSNHELRSHRNPTSSRKKTCRDERICPYCNKYSRSITAHKNHLSTHTGEKKMICICGETFGSTYTLGYHRKTKGCGLREGETLEVSENEKEEEEENDNNDDDEDCFEEKVKVENKDETSSLHEIKTEIIEETETGETFIIKMEVENDQILQEEDQEKNDKKSPIVFPCNTCNKILKSEYMYKRHIRTHEKYRLMCSICNCSYNSRRVLRAHIRIQHLNKIRCNICNEFVKKSQYKAHESRHNAYKPFECSICKKNFLTMGGLRTHKLCSHDGKIYDKRAFNCFFCGFNRNNFKTHMQSKFHQEKESMWKKLYQIDLYPCRKCNSTAYFENILELCQHSMESHNYNLHKNIEEYCKKLANILNDGVSTQEQDGENSKVCRTDTADGENDGIEEVLSCDKKICVKKEMISSEEEDDVKKDSNTIANFGVAAPNAEQYIALKKEEFA